MALQECQEAYTSTEFLEAVGFLEQVEWFNFSRQEYYLVQIAAEIRAFREGFSQSPKRVDSKDLYFPVDKFMTKMTGKDSKVESPSFHDTSGREAIEEPGPEVMDDPKWAAVTLVAKASWAARLGVESLEDLKRG